MKKGRSQGRRGTRAMSDIVIVSAARTPVGSFNGALSSLPAHELGKVAILATMTKDGLWHAFHGYHMGQTAENIAARWQITREDQDKFAVGSQNKAEAAQKAGKFAGEIAPVTIKGRKGDITVDQDEFIR